MLITLKKLRINGFIAIMGLFLVTGCGQTSLVTGVTSPPVATPSPSVPTATSAFIPSVPATSTPLAVPPNTASPTFAPTKTPTLLPPTPTPIPFKSTTRPIVPPDCCIGFSFTANNQLYFYDKPDGQAKAGTYTLDLDSGATNFLSAAFGNFTPDLELVAVSERNSNQTFIEKVKPSSRLLTLQNRASQTYISPDKKQFAYLLRSTNQAGAEAPQLFELWIGNLDGTNLRTVWSLREGANLSWFADSSRLLLTARDAANQRFGLWVVDTQPPIGKAATLIVENKGLTVASLSKNSMRVVYALSLQGDEKSGVWSVNSDGTNPQKMAWLGSWRWSSQLDEELFYLPATGSPGAGVLWSYNFNTRQALPLTDAQALPVEKIQDEWQIAPDNKNIVYRNSSDKALWLLRFRP